VLSASQVRILPSAEPFFGKETLGKETERHHPQKKILEIILKKLKREKL
jgi:hypothetical protein